MPGTAFMSFGIDGDRRVTWVHTGASGDGWASIVERGPGDPLTTPALPGFSIRLKDIRRYSAASRPWPSR